MRAWIRAALAAAILLLTSSLAHPQGPPPSPGTWSGPWSWLFTFQPSGVWPTCDFQEIAHASLIPKGLHRGKVLLWKRDTCSGSYQTATWIFDPSQPQDLIQVVDIGGVSVEFFCSGHSWDVNGNLVVSGGVVTGGSPSPSTSIWRFLPAALTNPTGNPPVITADVWRPAGTTTSPHWYPGMMTLTDEPLPILQGTGCSASSMPGGCSFILGGNYHQDGPPLCGNIGGINYVCKLSMPPLANEQICPECYKGSEFWERLAPRANQPLCPFMPNGLSTSDPHYVNSNLASRETYTLYDDNGNLLPATSDLKYLDGYPRAFQFSWAGNKEIFTAFDTASEFYLPNQTPANRSWLLKLPYASVMAPPSQPQGWTTWELRKAGESQPTGGNRDRYYGTAGMLSTLGTNNQRYSDRVIVAGGLELIGSPGSTSPHVNQTIQEYFGAAAATNPWRIQLTFTGSASSRYFINFVILPTREILLMGGQDVNSAHFNPIMFRPGDAPTNAYEGPYYLANNNIPNGLPYYPGWPAQTSSYSTPTKRLYHSVDVLLPDGTVFQAGGDDEGIQTGQPPAEYTGEIFSPPYLSYGFRPAAEPKADTWKYSTRNSPPHVEFVWATVQPQSATQFTHHIDRVVLLRPASVTHFFDFDQRYIELAFTETHNAVTGAWELSVESPTEDLAPAGYYMLFVIENDGGTPAKRVPSVGQFISFPHQ